MIQIPRFNKRDKRPSNITLPEQAGVTINCSDTTNNNPPNKSSSATEKIHIESQFLYYLKALAKRFVYKLDTNNESK